MNKLHRRDILRVGSGLALASGLSLLPRWASAQAGPRRRLVVFYTPNGHNAEAWGATANGTGYDLGSILAPLAPFKNDVMVVANLDNRAAADTESPARINPHWRGMYTVLTGTRCLSAPLNTRGIDYGYFGGASIDQVVAKRMSTPLKALNLGVQTGGNVVTATGAKGRLPCEVDPIRAFDRVAGVIKPAGTAPDPAAELLATRRKAVLDATLQELDRYAKEATGDEKDKILSHAESITELSASATSTATVSCTKPAKPAAIDLAANASFPKLVKNQIDLLSAALTCDVTRVATVQMSAVLSPVAHTWANAPGNHHLNSHEVAGTAKAQEYANATKWYAEQFAYLLGKLKAASDGGGKTLLDNTAVVWVSELGRGRSHSLHDKDFVVAGRLGTALRPGRFVSGQGKTINDFWISILQGLGFTDTTFGEAKYCSGGIPALK